MDQSDTRKTFSLNLLTSERLSFMLRPFDALLSEYNITRRRDAQPPFDTLTTKPEYVPTMSTDWKEYKQALESTLGPNFGSSQAGASATLPSHLGGLAIRTRQGPGGLSDQMGKIDTNLNLAFRPKRLGPTESIVDVVSGETTPGITIYTPDTSAGETPIYTPSTGSVTPAELLDTWKSKIESFDGVVDFWEGIDPETLKKALSEESEDVQHELLWGYGMARLIAQDEAPDENRADRLLSDRLTCVFRTARFVEELYADAIRSGLVTAKSEQNPSVSHSDYAKKSLESLVKQLQVSNLSAKDLQNSMEWYKDKCYNKTQVADRITIHALTHLSITSFEFVKDVMDSHDDLYWYNTDDTKVLRNLMSCSCPDRTGRNSLDSRSGTSGGGRRFPGLMLTTVGAGDYNG